MAAPYPPRTELRTRSSSDEAPFEPDFGLTSLDRPRFDRLFEPTTAPLPAAASERGPPSSPPELGPAAPPRPSTEVWVAVALLVPAAFGFLFGGLLALLQAP
jgi:hypothetical protein